MNELDHLHVEGSFSLKNIDLPLSNQGMVLIKGMNLDDRNQVSTGSGKSSLFETLNHILYESTARGLRKNMLMNLYTENAHYLGELSVRVKGVPYLFRQARDHADYGTATYIESPGQDFAGLDIATAQKKIQEIWGLSQAEFQSLIYIPQELKHPFLQSGGKVKRDLLLKLYDLEYSELQKKTEETIEAIKNSIISLDGQVLALRKESDTFNLPAKEFLEQELANLPDLNTLNHTLEIKGKERKELDDLIFRLQQFLDITKQVEAIKEEVSVFKSLSSVPEEMLKQLNDYYQSCKKYIEENEKFIYIFQELESKLKRKAALEKEIPVGSTSESLTRVYNEIKKAAELLDNRLKKLNEEYVLYFQRDQLLNELFMFPERRVEGIADTDWLMLQDHYRNKYQEISIEYESLNNQKESLNRDIVFIRKKRELKLKLTSYEYVRDTVTIRERFKQVGDSITSLQLEVKRLNDELHRVVWKADLLQKVSKYSELPETPVLRLEYKKIHDSMVEIKSQISGLEKRRKLAESGFCSECGSVFESQEIPDIDNNLNSLRGQLDPLVLRLKELDDLIIKAELRDGIIKDLEGLKEYRDDILIFKQELESKQNELSGFQSDYDGLKQELKSAEDRDRLFSEYSKFNEFSDDPQASEDLLKELTKNCGMLQSKISRVEKLLDLYRALQKYSLLDTNITSKMITDSIKGVNQEISELNAQPLLESLSVQINTCQELDRIGEGLDPTLTVDSVSKQLYELKLNLDSARSGREQSAKLIPLVENLKKTNILERDGLDINVLKIRVKDLIDTENSLLNEKATIFVRKNQLENGLKDWKRFESLKERLDKMEKEREDFNYNIRLYNAFLKAIGPRGLATRNLQPLVDVINDRLRIYVPLVTAEQIQVRLKINRDDIDVKVLRGNHELYGLATSPGEGNKLSLALLFAMRDCCPVHKQGNIMILDEIDKHVDATSARILLDAICEYRQRSSWITSMFVMTHTNTLHRLPIWDVTYTVVRENNVSQLVRE